MKIFDRKTVKLLTIQIYQSFGNNSSNPAKPNPQPKQKKVKEPKPKTPESNEKFITLSEDQLTRLIGMVTQQPAKECCSKRL